MIIEKLIERLILNQCPLALNNMTRYISLMMVDNIGLEPVTYPM